MRKDQLLRMCGSMEQVAFVRPVTFRDGEAEGLKCILVRNGYLEYALMESKCLDPAWINYKGINLSFLSKPGIQGRTIHDTDPTQAGRSMMIGGMMTCGFENIHGHVSFEGKDYPTHGRMRSTPAAKLSMDAYFREDNYVLSVRGEMREAEIFGENMVLRRTVESIYGEPAFGIEDEIENQAFAEQRLCFLYHCNFGYPLLSPKSRLILPSVQCTPRNADAEAGLEAWDSFGEPVDGLPEQVFIHRVAGNSEGNTFGALVNDELGIALCIEWNINEMPLVTQWKSMASGDYAMALEPCNTGFEGFFAPGEYLKPLETHKNHLTFRICEGKEEIKSLEDRRDILLRENGERL